MNTNNELTSLKCNSLECIPRHQCEYVKSAGAGAAQQVNGQTGDMQEGDDGRILLYFSPRWTKFCQILDMYAVALYKVIVSF